MPDASNDRDAARLATMAGELLLELRTRDLEPADLRDEGDRRSHELLMSELAAAHPRDAVLSEEGSDDLRRLDAERVWIVDPLDGTREYGEDGRSDWAVHVALWERGELTAGAVAQPALGRTYSTAEPGLEAWSGPERIRLAVSRTRPPAFVTELADTLDAELVPMGSAGIKAMAVLTDEADAYVHAGGQYEWDSAAPVAVCRAAGLHTSRLDGSPLRYNSPDPRLPDLVIARPEVAPRIFEALAGLGSAGD
jgi:3'(2'), 5'-bisphosphate nucleotidase